MGWLSERIVAILKRDNLTLRQFERKTGIGSGYLSMVINEKRKKIGEKVAKRLAEYSGFPIEYFLYEQNTDRKRLPNVKIRAIINDVLQSVELQAYIPVYDKIPVRKGMVPMDHVALTQAKPASESLQGFKIKGLSLPPEIKDGDIIIVDNAISPNKDDIVLVLTDDLPVLSRYNLVLPGTEIYGVVIATQKNFR